METNLDLLTFEDLNKLVEIQEPCCISIYLPTIEVGEQTRQNSIRFKNLLKQAEQRLTEDQEPLLRESLQKAQALIDESTFWQKQGKGLAVFISQSQFIYHRLPIETDELVITTNRFHIKRLLKLFSNDGKFFVLSLSQQHVHMLECSQYTFKSMELKNVPKNIEEALGHEEPNTTLQFHSGAEQGRRDGSPVYHGQGSYKDQVQDKVMRYFKVIDKALHNILHDQKAPLVVASVENYIAMFKEASIYPHVYPEGIVGSSDQLRDEELHEKAWEVVKNHFLEEQQHAFGTYQSISGTEKTTDKPEDVITAAFTGRVDTLFVASGVHVWGTVNEETLEIDVHIDQAENDQDLLDLAAYHTLKNGGKVFVLPQEKMPEGVLLASILRF